MNFMIKYKFIFLLFLLVSCEDKRQAIINELDRLQIEMKEAGENIDREYDRLIKLNEAGGANVTKDPKAEALRVKSDSVNAYYQRKLDSLNTEYEKI